MYCVKKITDDLTWIGGNDRRLALFEGVYGVPDGVSYNSYFIDDEKTVVMDTVDLAVADLFFENVDHMLAGRPLDYLVVDHMEPDHAATIEGLIMRHPEVTVVCNAKILTMIRQYFTVDIDSRVQVVKEGDVLSTGRHQLTFVMAPMVHWPEVMVTYDLTDKILFSADAFGTFGALNGHIFADEVDFFGEYLDEARRYYCNIVGKYGTQVMNLLKKAANLDLQLVCPLHGFVWRRGVGDFVEKYVKWASYQPEEEGVVIAYASVYGHTANVANILAAKLADRGMRVKMYDTSMTHSSYIVADCFKYSHLVFCSTTYNAGIFIAMEELLNDIAAHNLQNRTVAFIENGSWAPTSGGLMRETIGKLKNMNIINETLTIKSSLKEDQLAQLDAIVDAIAPAKPAPAVPAAAPAAEAAAVIDESRIDASAMFKFSYGLFVLTAREGDKDNGCIINTAMQLTSDPKRISIAVNKNNYTHDMIMRTGKFNVSFLTESVPFSVFQRFGFQSGRDADKFAGCDHEPARSANGIRYIPNHTNAFISGSVYTTADYGTHTLFVADVTEAAVLSDEPSVTYAYYFDHIKPKKKPAIVEKKGYVCKICGYEYECEGELPDDFECPLCKHGKEDFEPIAPPPPKKKGFVCKICGYEYEGDTLPADFVCPICKHGADDFEPIE